MGEILLIILVGFMAAGKSTVGAELARQLGFDFADLDEIIKKVEGMTIPEIFAAVKEAGFRDIEHRELVPLLRRTRLVIAAGGGTFVQPRNHGLMLQSGFVVYIKTPFDILLPRLVGDKDRPNAQKSEKDLYDLLVSRESDYDEAHYIVNGRRDVHGITGDIMSEITAREAGQVQ